MSFNPSNINVNNTGDINITASSNNNNISKDVDKVSTKDVLAKYEFDNTKFSKIDDMSIKERKEKLDEIFEIVNDNIMHTKKQFEYSVHEETNEIMVKLIDMETSKVLKEFPPEKNLDNVARLMKSTGLIVDEER